MPRFPKPWFRKDRRVWFVQLDGKQHSLGRDRKEAMRRYHALMSSRSASSNCKPAVVVNGSVLSVIDAYLDWCEKNRARRTYEWYRQRLQLFCDFIPNDLRLVELKPYHLQAWIDAYPSLADGGKRNYCRAVQRTMNWAEEMGHVERSPVAHFKKPPAGRRDTIVTEEVFREILAFSRDQSFQNLVTMADETGARPQELVAVEARHCDIEYSRWVFPTTDAANKTKVFPRIVYLTETALALTRRLMDRYPKGPLLRNSRGKPWGRESTNSAFIRIQIRMGKREMEERGLTVEPAEIERLMAELSPTKRVKRKKITKSQAELRCEAKVKLTNRLATSLAPKYCLYSFRHTWATRALERGLDALTVAVLMGHQDPSMLAKVYQHLSHNPEYLLKQTRRAIA